MLNLRKNKKGFTLLEILIVLVIVAVLAGLAIPSYQGAVEKSRSQEALASLGAVRASMTRYFALNNTYVGATFTCATPLDFNPNIAAGGQTLNFTYALSNLGAATFTVTATRVGGGAAAGSTVVVDQAGTVTRTGSYA